MDIFLRDKLSTVLTVPGVFKAGDPPPTGYCDWHEWADVQVKAGLKQRQCGRCSLWRFPQEMSAVPVTHVGREPTRKKYAVGKKVTYTLPVCLKCAGESP